MFNHTSQARQCGHAPVNGLNMYYEIHGPETGIPLVLLHGGGSTIESTFGKILPWFATGRPVIALEEQAHGRTSDREGPETFEGSADDVAGLLEFLAVEKADLLGFSAGAIVALQVAIRHPQQIRKLIFASSMIRRAGVPAQFWEFMKSADFSHMPQPLKDAFLRVNPNKEQLRVMHDKDAARMNNFTDIPDALITSMQVPTLILLGDQDIVKPGHALEMSLLLPDARLLIVPGGHGDYLGDIAATTRGTNFPQLIAGLIEEFLEVTVTGDRVLL